MKNKRLFLLSAFLVIIGTLKAQNPIITDRASERMVLYGRLPCFLVRQSGRLDRPRSDPKPEKCTLGGS